MQDPARNDQYLGVNQAYAAVQSPKLDTGKLGVFWHTQGSGKSYSMAFLARKVHWSAARRLHLSDPHRPAGAGPPDHKTFAGVGAVTEAKEACQATSGTHLKQLLGENHAYIFSLIHKFNQKEQEPYTTCGSTSSSFRTKRTVPNMAGWRSTCAKRRPTLPDPGWTVHRSSVAQKIK